jgi:hypothetical protein
LFKLCARGLVLIISIRLERQISCTREISHDKKSF